MIVCGSRNCNERDIIIERLAELPSDTTIVHGNAAGADRIAHQEAQKLGLLVESHPYQPFIGPGVPAKRAPLERNKHMASLGADLCIAFWDGRSTGTNHMMARAYEAEIPVEVVRV